MRATIDFGIDLGTTNSAVAVVSGGESTVLRNNKRREFTPSAVYVTNSGAIHVGDAARDRIARDPENVCTEFKIQMGSRGDGRMFPASGRTFTPEELSGEVLKALRGNVRRELGEELTGAVVTVPAAFELDQTDATVNAAKLAGIDAVTLIQEPTAAAWAYGADSRAENSFWLVYDFGGGTFDAAVIKVEDGEFSVLNHEGDNFLGGKLIDWALVQDVMIPALGEQLPAFAGVSRADPIWAGTVAKLKLAAEQAKIDLSESPATEVWVDLDYGGQTVEFRCEVSQKNVEDALRPLFSRSLNLCKKALADVGLAPVDLDKVLLVGGSTLIPILRDQLADPGRGLGVPLDYSIDPVTVVARGAALFASTLRSSSEPAAPSDEGIVIQLEYEPVVAELDPFVAGCLHSNDQQYSGYAVEFVDGDARPPWRSGQIEVAAGGDFGGRLRLRSETATTFTVEVRDHKGTVVTASPRTVTLRHTAGAVGGGPGASHSLGVLLSDNSVRTLIAKNAALPAQSGRVVLYTTVEIDRAGNAGLIRVPLVNGERARGDRNTEVGSLELRASDVRMTVRAGSEVEVMVWMDASQRVEASAYIPLLDEEFPIEVDMGRERTDAKGVRRGATEVIDRHRDLVQRIQVLDAPDADRLLRQLEDEGALDMVEDLARAAEADPDAEQEARSRVRAVEAALDDVEDALTTPAVIEGLRTALRQIRGLVEEIGDGAERHEFERLEADAKAIIHGRDRTLIAHHNELVRDLATRVLRRTGHLYAALFADMEPTLVDHPDVAVQDLLRRGRHAVNRRDNEELESVVRQLRRYLPSGAPSGDYDRSTVRDQKW